MRDRPQNLFGYLEGPERSRKEAKLFFWGGQKRGQAPRSGDLSGSDRAGRYLEAPVEGFASLEARHDFILRRTVRCKSCGYSSSTISKAVPLWSSSLKTFRL